MGARQSKRSVDITTTPKKEGLPVEGVVGDAAAPGDGKLEKIEETDVKPTTNGVAPHTDATPEDKEKDKDEATEKENEKEDETKTEEVKVESPTTETPAEGAVEVTTPTEGTPASPTTATSPDSKETKKKDKLKKKWSFRSISFGKKDKSKPAREDAPKNGDVTKEEPLAEGGEEAETAEAAVTSPADEKSAVSSPTETEQNAVVAETTATESVPTEEKKIVATPSPVIDESKDDTSCPVPTPVPVVEAKKIEEIEKSCEPASVEKKVEVSQVSTVIEASPIEVNSQSKQKSTVSTTATSIIERKTSEDIPSQFPSSPPPTPIDPSPLQQAQQVAANATALAEALKLPAEAANKANITYASGKSTIFATSPTSKLLTEMPTDIKSPPAQNHQKPVVTSNSSEFPEQTGKISPIPIVISTITTAVMETIEKSSNLPEKKQVPITEKITNLCDDNENSSTTIEKTQLPVTEKINVLTDDLEKSSTIVEKTQLPVTEKISDISDDIVKKSESSVETIKSEMPRENDLVIQTEEGPVPISDIIVVEAKPAIVIPDSPVGKTVQVLLEPEKNHDSVESVKEIVESTEAFLGDVEDKIEVIQTLSEPIVPVPVSKPINEEIAEKDVPPPLPDSPIPVPKVTSQLLNFISTQIEDSSVIPEIIDTTTQQNIAMNLIDSAEDVPTPQVLQTVEPSETSEEVGEIQKTTLQTRAMDILVSAEDVPTPQVLETVDSTETSEEFREIQNTTIQTRTMDLLMSAEDVPTPQVLETVDSTETSEEIREIQNTTIQTRAMDLLMSAEDVPTPQVLETGDPLETSDDIKKIEETDESHSLADEQRENTNFLPSLEEVPGSRLDELSQAIDDSNLSPVTQEIIEQVPSLVTFEGNHQTIENTKNSTMSDLTPSLEISIPQIPTETTLPTPPRSPIDDHDDLPIKNSSSLLELSDDPSNREFKMESVDQSLNSYNDSELELKERLAESMEENTLVNGQFTLNNVQDNDQSKTEVEAPVENNVAQNDIGTTEANDEAPKSPPPAVPADAPAPILGPAITEDVASVTKAIEEIDINEKAVAAAVNENIESINTNEIIADMNHQNNMNE